MTGDPRALRWDHTLLKDGQVVRVGYERMERGRSYDRDRWFAYFNVVEEGEHFGSPVVRVYSAPRPGHLPRSSNLYLDYRDVTGLRPPRLSAAHLRAPDKFLRTFLANVELLARTRIVGRVMDERERRWVETPKTDHYSLIEKFVGISAGTPQANRGRGT